MIIEREKPVRICIKRSKRCICFCMINRVMFRYMLSKIEALEITFFCTEEQCVNLKAIRICLMAFQRRSLAGVNLVSVRALGKGSGTPNLLGLF